MSWYRLELGDPVLAQADLAEIRRLAEKAFRIAGRPSGWMIYLAHVSGELHCCAELYFSPAAVELARRLGARPCNAPAGDMSLLAGNGD